MTNNSKLLEKDFWELAWDKYFDHYQQDTRHAYYINAFLNSNESKILEMASGSFRDFAVLNSLGHDCFAFDYCENAVDRAKKTFSHLSDKISVQNAFQTTYKDNEFDFSYHNGFWVLFNDLDILKLAKEQLRITSKRISFTVHNGHNQDFINYFNKLKQNEPLYDIRFFKIDEITNIVKQLPVKQESLKIYPVGKGKKFHEDELIKTGQNDASTIRKCIESANLSYLTSSERLLCIVDKQELL